MSAIRVGVAEADITPRHPVALAGFAARLEPFESVRGSLSAQVFAFGRAGGSGDVESGPAVVLVCADLLWWGPDVAESLRERISARHGLPEDAIILHASHTHSGPQPGLTFSPLIGAGDEDYVRLLQDAVMAAVAEAMDDMEPVTVARGQGHCAIGMNRRRAHADGTFGGPDPDGPVDHDVDVIRLDTASGGATKAVLVHYACHPVVTADRRVGPDFPGAVRTQLSRRLGNGAVIAFLQGCCGDINPGLVRDGGFYRGDTADVEKLGGELATAAAATLEAGLDPCGAPVLAARSTLARLPLHPPSRDTLARRRNEDGIWGDWSRHLWAHPDQVVEEVPLRLTLVELTDDLALLGFDAEMTVAYGQFVKSRSKTRRVLPLGYTNGMIGYVVTAQQVREGGYEPEGSYPYVYRPGPFTTGAEQVVKSAVDALLADTQVAAAATGGRP